MRLLIIITLLFTALALAQDSYPRDITYCWTHPSTYTDDSDIQPGDLANTRITIDRHDGTRIFDGLVPVVELPGARQCNTLTGVILKPGTYTGISYAITIDGTSSVQSNDYDKKYTGKPNPNENLAAQ